MKFIAELKFTCNLLLRLRRGMARSLQNDKQYNRLHMQRHLSRFREGFNAQFVVPTTREDSIDSRYDPTVRHLALSTYTFWTLGLRHNFTVDLRQRTLNNVSRPRLTNPEERPERAYVSSS